MITRDSIASIATPRFRYQLQPLVEDRDVAVAINEIASATNITDLKALAYAIHVGVMTPDEAGDKLGQPSEVLRSLSEMLAALPAINSDLIEKVLSHGIAGYQGRVMGNSQEEGWALTLFDMLHDSKFANWLDIFELSDPARIGLRWAVQGILSEEETSSVVAIWASKGDSLHIAAAGFLVLASVDSELHGAGSMIPIDGLQRLPKAIIGGRVLANLLAQSRNLSQTGDIAQRRSKLIERLKANVKQWLEIPTDLKQFVHSGVRNEHDLISFLLTLPLSSQLKRTAGYEADDLLKRSFKRVENRAQLDEGQLMYVAGWMINPLAHAAVSIRMSVDLFRDLLDNLAFDEYAHDVDHSLYLNDRARAILLCAIGAIVSVENSDPDLAAETRSAVDILRNLPPGVGRFGDAFTGEFKTKYGVELPAA